GHGQTPCDRSRAVGNRCGRAAARWSRSDARGESRGIVPRDPGASHLRGGERSAAPGHCARLAQGGEEMKILQPPGWPRPKGYSNGISAKGRMIFTGGIVGWDEHEAFPEF